MSDSGSDGGERDRVHDLEDEEERGGHHTRSEHHLRESDGGEGHHGKSSSSPSHHETVERTECCSACLSKNRNNGRSCICQVPAKQRRAPLGSEGCVTCKCTGCHPDDIAAKGESRSYSMDIDDRYRDKDRRDSLERSNGEKREERRSHRSERDREMRDLRAYDDTARDSREIEHQLAKERERELELRIRDKESRGRRSSPPPMLTGDEPLKNGCCKPCMKAFSETKKACLCQVPMGVRKGHLPEAGCKVCGCHGCHPEEKNSTRHMRLPPYGSRPSSLLPRYLAPPPLVPPFYPPPLPPPVGRSRDMRELRDYRDSRDSRDPRDSHSRDGRDSRDRDSLLRDRDLRDFRDPREIRDPHMDDRRGGLLPYPPFPYPMSRPEYLDPFSRDPRFDRDGLYAREREMRERYSSSSSHREGRGDRDYERSRSHTEKRDRDSHRDTERDREREHERERERERERRDRDDSYRKRERRESDHYSSSSTRESKRSRELL